MLTLVFASLAMVSSELQVRAKGEYEENRLSAAAETLETAKSVMPLNSSLFHDSGDVNLNLHQVETRRHDISMCAEILSARNRAQPQQIRLAYRTEPLSLLCKPDRRGASGTSSRSAAVPRQQIRPVYRPAYREAEAVVSRSEF